MQDLHPFFAERHFIDTHSHLVYDKLQWGNQLHFATQQNLDLGDADIVIIGCGERRGHNTSATYSTAADAIRKQLYQLYNWHPTVKITDAGNILQAPVLMIPAQHCVWYSTSSTKQVRSSSCSAGSNDLALQQYEAFKTSKQVVQCRRRRYAHRPRRIGRQSQTVPS